MCLAVIADLPHASGGRHSHVMDGQGRLGLLALVATHTVSLPHRSRAVRIGQVAPGRRTLTHVGIADSKGHAAARSHDEANGLCGAILLALAAACGRRKLQPLRREEFDTGAHATDYVARFCLHDALFGECPDATSRFDLHGCHTRFDAREHREVHHAAVESITRDPRDGSLVLDCTQPCCSVDLKDPKFVFRSAHPANASTVDVSKRQNRFESKPFHRWASIDRH
mmetsp:Transcript_88341/g.248836  ORF Transcript_88341/g.248836 Transcript_88341/m.248836 type:complete len:226 (+) Transcript_88341:761-1438(+)